MFNKKPLKPYYELATFDGKIFLISVYFYKPGKELSLPENAVAIKGKYFEQIEHKGSSTYTKKERAIRDNQMFLDMLFKYIRHGDKKVLTSVEKYSKLK